MFGSRIAKVTIGMMAAGAVAMGAPMAFADAGGTTTAKPVTTTDAKKRCAKRDAHKAAQLAEQVARLKKLGKTEQAARKAAKGITTCAEQAAKKAGKATDKQATRPSSRATTADKTRGAEAAEKARAKDRTKKSSGDKAGTNS